MHEVSETYREALLKVPDIGRDGWPACPVCGEVVTGLEWNGDGQLTTRTRYEPCGCEREFTVPEIPTS